MKKVLLTTMAAMTSVMAFAGNEAIKVSHDGINEYAALAEIDSIYFSADRRVMFVLPVGGEAPLQIDNSQISEISFLPLDECPGKLKVAYNGTSVAIDNPYWLSGVSASAQGAYVVVNNLNTDTEYTTELSGTTSNGSFQYNGTYKTTLVLNGVEITSQKGAAIDIQCGKRVDLELKKGTTNTLVDAANGTHKAALYCKGHLEIDKAGTLNVTGKTAHAISAKEYIKMKKSEGVINILSAVNDGIHCKQYYLGNGFTINIENALDDGIQCELDSAANDDNIDDGSVIINGGTYRINMPSTTATRTETAGGFPGGWGGTSSSTAKTKGIKAEGPAVINDGSLCILTNKSEAEGLESKVSVTINGGNHYFKCYDDCINSSGIINFAGGNTVCYGYKNDAVDSNYGKKGAITISGGNVFAYSTAGSPEEGLDCDNNSYLVITGGMAISAGGSQGGGGGGGRPGGWGSSSSTSQSVGSSTQGYFLGSSPSSYGTSYYYTLCNTSGVALCTYKFEGSVTNSLSLLTASDLGKGSVTVKYSTAAPDNYDAQVCNASDKGVFFVNPTITTSGTTATVTAK